MTYQQEAKQKARENFSVMAEDAREYGEFPKELEEHITGFFEKETAQTITDLLDELQEEMGEEQHIDINMFPPQIDIKERIAYNNLHRKLTKKINQRRE